MLYAAISHVPLDILLVIGLGFRFCNITVMMPKRRDDIFFKECAFPLKPGAANLFVVFDSAINDVEDRPCVQLPLIQIMLMIAIN